MNIFFNINKTDIKVRKECIVCYSKNLSKISSIYYKNKFVFFSTSICKTCGFIFRDNHPSNNWFKKQYEKRSAHQLNKNIGIDVNYEKFRVSRYKKLLNFLEKKIKFKNVIDIGCATGLGLKVFKDRNYKILGIDTDKTRIRFGKKKKLNLKNTDIYKLDQKNKFDLVLCIHTLEHFTNPEIALNKIVKFLSKDSHIYIEVPDFKNLVRTWDDSIYLAHISNFSENNLIYFLKKFDLKPLFRTYPQTENGEINLGILCKFTPLIKKRLNIKKKLKLPKIDNYKLVGKNRILSIPYKVNLEMLNDISFAYKFFNKKKNNKLEQNFKRKLVFNKLIKKYEIDKNLTYFKTKKISFHKKIKNKIIS